MRPVNATVRHRIRKGSCTGTTATSLDWPPALLVIYPLAMWFGER